MNKLKRNLVVVTVLFFVCAAVYLNWSYNNSWGEADDEMVSAEDEAMLNAENEFEQMVLAEGDGEAAEVSDPVSEYFAEARLTRQQSRDEALELLETAAMSEGASVEIIDSAMNEISVMASFTMSESQIENQLIAREFADCVVFMTDNEISVAVPAPAEGLDASAVAKITETVTSGTNYTMEQIKVIEVKTE